ncbi:serine--tRNA ligase [Iodidimonas gelatinilytica]|uniref:Serine--tRNA ligase n=1 Tax=Iodidimonas gelatinilytica TaxID=1236966 RepID=A0A5A7N0U8_9PROT|nr:serine--tRNA ligase [Iodidimonas gelatinilytica]GER01325.1 serine--tRNA ligase [Iodidimonas gelatinilytica]
MLDISLFREDPEAIDAALARRGVAPVGAKVAALDSRRRALLTDIQKAQAERNETSKGIGLAKREGRDAQDLMDAVSALKEKMAGLEADERAVAAELDDLLLGIPNVPLDDTPDGADEADNVQVRVHGEKPHFSFAPKEHFELGEALGLMDFEVAARLSGSRFVVLKGGLARLERALGQFMLDLQTTEHGYEEVATPYLVRSDALIGTGQLPKFSEDLYRAGDEHWLIPTAEVTLTNLGREHILTEEDLPIRVTALTPCFRSEAGAAGRDTRGMLRQHQFSKVELVSVTTPEDSRAELDRLVGCAEEVLKRLGIAYRVMRLCTGDMGFSAQATFDIEAWLPGQNTYREISSCSLCGDFQARRMRMRSRGKAEKKTRFPHTLNGSGLALGRTLIAVMETYQNEDGSITVPEALKPYMGGMDRITP